MGERLPLSLDNLKRLDLGTASKQFQMALDEVIADLVSRPMDETKREVTLTLSLVPQADHNRQLVAVMATFMVKSKRPGWRTMDYQLAVSAAGDLMFNPDSPDDVRQGTLPLDETSGD